MSDLPVPTDQPQATRATPRWTALHARHEALGARLIDFAGWHMPVQYSGIIEEHRQVRSAAGLFDLSHMGELWVRGPGAGEGLAAALVSDPRRLAPGRAHYSMICAADGGILDDLIVYRTGGERFLVVPNASNSAVVAAALHERLAPFAASLDDASLRTSLVAVQGPGALDLLAPLCDVDIGALRYYAITEGRVAGVAAHIARTGYTGEDGFELFVAWQDALPVWDACQEVGRGGRLLPCGLGARDTLRLEAGMPLYGNELDPSTTPADAGLGRVVRFDKGIDFTGRAALEAAGQAGPRKRLVGLELRGRGIARHGHAVHAPGEADRCGVVTSGTLSPTLGRAIAMAYVPPGHSEVGTMLEVAIRDARVPAEVVALPFYRRAS